MEEVKVFLSCKSVVDDFPSDDDTDVATSISTHRAISEANTEGCLSRP